MIDIGFTGTRGGLRTVQSDNLLRELVALREKADVMDNGCCEGSDRIAWSMWRDLGGRFRLRPGDRDQWDWAQQACRREDELFAPVGYMERNELIARNPVVVATPAEDAEMQRSGTWATIRRARRAESYLILISPNGIVYRERTLV